MQIYRQSCVTVVLFLLYRMILHHFGLLKQDFYSQPRKVCKTRPSSKDKTIYHMLVKCRTLETIVGSFDRITEATRKRHSGFLSQDFKVSEREFTDLIWCNWFLNTRCKKDYSTYYECVSQLNQILCKKITFSLLTHITLTALKAFEKGVNELAAFSYQEQHANMLHRYSHSIRTQEPHVLHRRARCLHSTQVPKLYQRLTLRPLLQLCSHS